MTQKTVIIVGSGLAGLSCAIEAQRENIQVILLEKEAKLGGNSMKASSGINVMISPEDRDMFINDTLNSGGEESVIELVTKLVDDSPSALDWLKQQGPLDLSLVTQCGGHSVARTHRCASKDGHPVPVGWKLIETLKGRLNAKVLTETQALKLLVCEDRVCGVHVRGPEGDYDIKGDAVILTTGGFGGQTGLELKDGQRTLLSEFAPHLVDTATTNGPWASGDGIRLGLSVNAGTRGMDKVQLHPTGFVDPKQPSAPVKFLAPEALRAYGGILLNGKGERFVNELGLRHYVTEHIQNQAHTIHERPHSWMTCVLPKGYPAAYLVLTEEMVVKFGIFTLSFYVFKGIFIQKNLDDLVNKVLDVEREQIEAMFPGQDTFWVALVTPVVHYTMGGLKMNTKASLLTEEDEVIKGLYGAGEVTGGVHGLNRLAGNSLLECVVFGRTAGHHAVVYAQGL